MATLPACAHQVLLPGAPRVLDGAHPRAPLCTHAQAEALASGAVRAAHKMDAKLIVVFTVTGRTARLVAK